MKIFYGLLLLIVAQASVFMQSYAPMKIEWLRENWWFKYAIAIPVTFLFFKGVALCAEGFGDNWPVRFMTFAAGTLTFAALNHHIFGEVISSKTIVCLILSISIIIIQVVWK